MKFKTLSRITLVGVLGFALAGCLSPRQAGTVGGAALGGVAGSVISDGNPLLTIGGAALGGLLGNQVSSDGPSYRDRGRSYRHDNGRHRGWNKRRRWDD